MQALHSLVLGCWCDQRVERVLTSGTFICFWWRHELRQLWYMRVPPWVVCVFPIGYSSAPEWLEPVLWPRTWLFELMWEQQQQQQQQQLANSGLRLILKKSFQHVTCEFDKFRVVTHICIFYKIRSAVSSTGRYSFLVFAFLSFFVFSLPCIFFLFLYLLFFSFFLFSNWLTSVVRMRSDRYYVQHARVSLSWVASGIVVFSSRK